MCFLSGDEPSEFDQQRHCCHALFGQWVPALFVAIKDWGCQQPHDLSRITAPTLIANGDHDRMVPTSLSEDMHQRIPNSTVVIYPDAGHGGVFHRYQEFIPTLLAHLDA